MTCADKHWEMLGDVSYSSRNAVRKKICMNNYCSKTSTFGCSMMPQLSLCELGAYELLCSRKGFTFLSKTRAGETYIWAEIPLCPVLSSQSSALLPALLPPSCLPCRFYSAQKERGLSSPRCLCLASGGQAGGRWYLVSLLARTENSF